MGIRLIKIYKDSTRYLDQDGKSARLNSSKLATARRNYIGTPTDRTYYASCGDVICMGRIYCGDDRKGEI